jgi:hypothetical protein
MTLIFAVRPLQGGKTSHIKRLQNVRRVWRHTEGNYLVLLAKSLKGERLVAPAAVDYKQHVATHPPPLYLLNKVLQPGYTNLVRSPAVTTNPNAPLRLQIREPGRVVVLCFEDKVGRYCPAHRVDGGDKIDPLTVSLLDANRVNTSLWSSDYFNSVPNAHREASLIKVVDISVQYAVLRLNIPYRVEPGPDNLWIAAKDSLTIALSI